MSNVKFSVNKFEKYVKISEDIKEKIALFGTPLEGIDNEFIEIEVFPNRPDLLSFQGYIKSFLSFLGKNTGLREYKINKALKDYEVIIDSGLLKIRPYTACAIVKNLKFDNETIKEVIDIQEKIHRTLGRNRKKIAIGIYPLEKIKLPIYFSAKKPEDIVFMPLDFDKELNARQILRMHPTGREYSYLLDGFEKYPVFIDSSGEVLSLPPIINSHKTGRISEETKEIFIECSGHDLNSLKKAINILVTMFSDMGGELYEMNIKHKKGNYKTPDLTTEKIKINIEHVNKLLGIELSEKEIKSYLERMGHNYNKGVVEVGAWRTDILHENDIIEDVAIAYGYDNFEPEIPFVSTLGKEAPLESFKRKISEIFCGLGFLEVSSLHLTTKEDQFKKMCVKKFDNSKIISVKDSKTEYKLLRSDLSHSCLKILRNNVDAEYPQKIFEFGKVFEKDFGNKTETGVIEKENLCVTICDSKFNFTEIKRIFDYFMKMIRINYSLEETERDYFISGRCGDIYLEKDNKKEYIGFIGEIKPAVLNNQRISMPVSLFEIDLKKVFSI